VPARNLQIAKEEGRFSDDGWRVRKDGSKFFASVEIDPIWSEGRLIGFAKVTRDVSERIAAQEKLHDAQAALYQAQKMEAIGKLTLGLAHDFNNLLTIIINGLELVEARAAGDERLLKYIGASLRAAERGSLLTRQLLTFGRGQNLVPQTSDVNQLVREAMELAKRSCGENISVLSDLHPQLPAIDVDRAQFEAALINLVCNSRDAMPQGGCVVIATAKQEFSDPAGPQSPKREMIKVTVKDDGEGIPLEVQNRVFEPFFTTKEIGKGSGLGLSQVFGFAQQSDGFTRIESVPGSGTSVEIWLPIKA
jgi:signal transduction histidine kinase